jgi:transposase
MSNIKYSKEFKVDAISLVSEQGYSQADAGRSLGIDPRLISRWIKEYEKGDGQAFRGNGKLTEEQLEIKRLKEAVKRLTMEKEILKKATAFFAKEIK